MDREKQVRLTAAGFTVGTVAEFLDLSEEESALIEMRLSMARACKERRLEAGFTQAALAKRLGSSQSRIAKMEAGDPSVSLDLLIRAMLAMSATREQIAHAMAGGVMLAKPHSDSIRMRSARAATQQLKKELAGHKETVHLLESPTNAARLLAALKRKRHKK
ncbi:MAG: helix-turn-helix domain-containing protein [Gemmatimonadaceae bacterium]|nr:helix-turn-helix domain-containing protein [Gemmatimonadaceae bacterium]